MSAQRSKNGSSRVEAMFHRCLVERGVRQAYYRCRGMRYRMKAEVAIEEMRSARACLNHPDDRVGLAGFDTTYRTYLAPTPDHRRLDPALRQLWRDVTDPEPRSSLLWRGTGELQDAFHAHSAGRVQVGIILTDGGDNTFDLAESAGVRAQQFMAADPGCRHIEVIGVGRDGAVDYGSLGRYAKFGQLTMLGDVGGLGAVVRRVLYRVVARVTGVAAQNELGTVSLRMLQTTLAVERVGIDLMFAVDTSPSMAEFQATLPEPGAA